jgi:TonB family protein
MRGEKSIAVTRFRRNKLARAAAASSVCHLALFALLVGHAAQQVPAAASDETGSLWGDATAAAVSPTWVDLRSVAEILPPPEPTEPSTAPDDHALPQADEARAAANETAPARGTTPDRSRAAADSGDDRGRQAPTAFRRDRSTLRTRLADNGSAYQIEHERTAGQASSPQPIRQEPRVGVGDLSRTQRRRAGDSLAARDSLASDPDGAFAAQATVEGESAQQTGDGHDRARGDGPLDVDQGKRRFDVDEVGVAQDARTVRAASNESHPGRFELSSPSATGDGTAGRGPGQEPGAVSRPSPGSAAATSGAPRDAPKGELTMSAAEREYQRSLAEIERRVHARLRFPRRLALELEQGETVVRFVVRPDGHLDGAVRIMKSAGFDEFDAEAVSAVTRAAPFPPMSRALTFSMQIGFDNPMVR